MPHYTIDYTNVKGGAARHQAIEDIKDWMGNSRFDALSPEMKLVTDPRQFQFYAGLTGVEGFPVEAWYDLYHGEGAYLAAWAELERSEQEEGTA